MTTRLFTLLAAVLAAFLFTQTAGGQALHDVHVNAGLTCNACHTQLDPISPVPDATCVACHGTMIGEPREGGNISFPDPHRSPHLAPGEVPACTECHRIHQPSEVTCTVCHRAFEFEIK